MYIYTFTFGYFDLVQGGLVILFTKSVGSPEMYIFRRVKDPSLTVVRSDVMKLKVNFRKIIRVREVGVQVIGSVRVGEVWT